MSDDVYSALLGLGAVSGAACLFGVVVLLVHQSRYATARIKSIHGHTGSTDAALRFRPNLMKGGRS